MSDTIQAGALVNPGRASPRIVALAAVTWDFPLVGRTRMLVDAWMRRRQPVLFVEIPSYRSAWQRLTGLWWPRLPAPVVRAWPTYPARWWAGLDEHRLRRSIGRRARWLRQTLDDRVVWDQTAALVVTPAWTPWLAELPFGQVVYDCIDNLAVQTPRADLAALYRRWEDELIERSSGVVTSANVLADGIRERRPDLPIAVIRNGVDVARFRSLADRSARPRDLPAGTRPLIGFVGALYEWIDWPLIKAVVRALPECDFVFVGPHHGRSDVASIASLPNVRLLGPKPYDQVPAYVNSFTACWVPFVQDRVGQAANPVKIYEYLALGKPVVSTPVADTDSFEGHVAVGRTAEEIVELLRAALDASDEQVAERVTFAQSNSWDARAASYLDFIASLPAAASGD